MATNKYINNFLKVVIFRIDFSPIVKLATGVPAEFQDKVRNEFPGYKEEQEAMIEAQIKKLPEASEPITINNLITWPRFVFLSKDSLEKITLTKNYLAIEFFKYSDYSDFCQCIKKVYSFFYDLYQPIDITRFGVRYINQIDIKEGDPFKWENLVNHSLTYNVDHFIDDKKDIARAMNQIILIKDDFKVNFNYGFYNSEFPSKISRKEFALDFDCYTTEVNEGELFNLLDKFNETIKNYFELCIGDGLRDIMEVKKDE